MLQKTRYCKKLDHKKVIDGILRIIRDYLYKHECEYRKTLNPDFYGCKDCEWGLDESNNTKD